MAEGTATTEVPQTGKKGGCSGSADQITRMLHGDGLIRFAVVVLKPNCFAFNICSDTGREH